MQLYSLQFVAFLLVSVTCYFAVGKRWPSRQWWVLLVASMGFYLANGWQHVFFILFTAATTYAIGLRFAALDTQCEQERASAPDRSAKKDIRQRYKQRKWIFALLAMLLNFGVLGYIKYWNVLLAGFGAENGFLASRLLLPLGISFYTFQSISYVIDVYNGKYPPETNPGRYLLFVSWFPQLIQGPINRFDDMVGQLYERHSFDFYRARRALLLVGFGCLKKFAIADVLVQAISNCIDQIGYSTPGSVIAFGILLYTVQQYGDFSGGIDMVRGVSQLFGVQMAENFRQPYFSVSLSDFWRRWHMTLGSWMRDYVFYPLAVHPSMLKLNRWGTEHLGKQWGRTLSACISNIIVFLLVGLWHGAETHYVLWGLYNGVVIAAADVARPVFSWLNRRLHVPTESIGWRIWCILRTFFLVNIGRYFDRFEDFGDCLLGFHNTIFNFRASDFLAGMQAHPTSNLTLCLLSALVGCVVVFVVSIQRERGVDVGRRVLALPFGVRLALYAALGAVVAFSFSLSSAGGGFLYANF